MNAIATLPMYTMPGTEDQNDRLWSAIRDNLRARGIPAPQTLTRDGDAVESWNDPSLCLSQTCGLPLVTGRAGQATVLGAFDYGLPDCDAGHYYSVIVARSEVPTAPRFAYNEAGSQSGYAALKRHMGPSLGIGIETGSHVASIQAVAAGRADIAAIDAVTWQLALSHEPAAQQVQVIDRTPQTPGLPLITAPGRDPAPFRDALSAALSRFEPGQAPLRLRGFVPFDLSDYKAAIWPID